MAFRVLAQSLAHELAPAPVDLAGSEILLVEEDLKTGDDLPLIDQTGLGNVSGRLFRIRLGSGGLDSHGRGCLNWNCRGMSRLKGGGRKGFCWARLLGNEGQNGEEERYNEIFHGLNLSISAYALPAM